MAFEVIRHQLPLFDEEGRAAATDDEHGRDLHYLWEAIGMDVPETLRDLEDPGRHQNLKDEEYSMPLNRGVGA